MADVKNIIHKQYQSLLDETISVKNKCNIFNNVIEIKLQNNELLGTGQSITKDFKIYFKNLVLLEEDTSTLYDSIKLGKIKSQLKKLDFNSQIDLLKYFKRKLKVAGHETYAEKLSKIEYDFKIKHYKKEWYRPNNIYNLLIIYPFNGIQNIITSLVIVYFVFSIFTLPAFTPNLEFYNIEYHIFCKNFLLNHFSNTLSFLFGIESDFQITPNSVFALIFSVIIKVTFILIVINTLIVKALEHIKL